MTRELFQVFLFGFLMVVGTETAREPSDREIVGRVVGGDKDAYQDLVFRYQDRIHSLIMRQLGDQATAKELTQDVFVRAFLALDKFRWEAKFSSWITRIALNVVNNYFSSRRYKESLRSVELDPKKLELNAAPEDSSNYSEAEIRQLQIAISKLKPKFREVLVLCSLEKKTYEQASEILGVPVGTVCSRMNTAFNLVRASFFGD